MSKHRKILWGLVIIVLVASVGLLVAKKSGFRLRNSAESIKANAVPTPSPASQEIKVLYQSSRLPMLPKKEDRLSQGCIDYISSVRGVDLRLVRSFPPKSPPFPIHDQCKELPKSLVEMDVIYLEACATLMKPAVELNLKIWMESLPPCVTALFNFRALLTHFLTRSIPIEDITDERILLDKMMATMGGTDYPLNEKLALRLLELEPTLAPAAEMVTLSRFKQAQADAKGNANDKKWEVLEHSLNKLIEMGVLNPKQALEWQLMINLSKNSDYEESKKYAEKMAAQYPNWSLPLYYQAWATFYLKDAGVARKLLDRARKLDSSDPRLKEAIEKIYKNDPNPFRSDFAVNFPKEVFD